MRNCFTFNSLRRHSIELCCHHHEWGIPRAEGSEQMKLLAGFHNEEGWGG